MFCTKLLKHVSTLSKKKKKDYFMCKFVSINIKCPSWQSKDVFVTWWMLQRITSFKKSGMWLRPVMSCVCCLHTGRLIHIWNHNVLTEHCSIEILGPRKKTKKEACYQRLQLLIEVCGDICGFAAMLIIMYYCLWSGHNVVEVVL